VYIAILVAPHGFLTGQVRSDLNRFVSEQSLRQFPPNFLAKINTFETVFVQLLRNLALSGLTDFLSVHIGDGAHEKKAFRNVDGAVEEHLTAAGIPSRPSVMIPMDTHDLEQTRRRAADMIMEFGPHRSRGSHGEQPPAFDRLDADKATCDHLKDQWIETQCCVEHGIPLAAIIMMGSLLEGVLWSRARNHPDKAVVFQSKRAPRDNSGKTKDLDHWGLESLIEVANELKWIHSVEKVQGALIRKYRNFAHPREAIKARQDDGPTSRQDARVLWSSAKAIISELLNGAPR
jgi:hypothetical protein